MLKTVMSFFLLFTVFVFAEDIAKEDNARHGEVASKYVLYKNGDLFRYIDGTKYQITNQVVDFAVGRHPYDPNTLYFIKEDNLYGLIGKKSKEAETKLLLEKVAKSEQNYQFYSIVKLESEISMIAIDQQQRLFVFNHYDYATKADDIVEFQINKGLNLGQSYNKYTAFARNKQGHVLKIAATIENNFQWNRRSYNSLQDFFAQNPQDRYEAPVPEKVVEKVPEKVIEVEVKEPVKNNTPNVEKKAISTTFSFPFAFHYNAIQPMSVGEYRQISSGNLSGYNMQKFGSWEAKYPRFTRTADFFALLQGNRLVTIVMSYRRIDTGYQKNLCIPLKASNAVWKLLYDDIDGIRGWDAKIALAKFFGDFIMYMEKLQFTSAVATTFNDYNAVTNNNLQNYDTVSLGSQKVLYGRFSREVFFTRVKARYESRTTAIQATYKRFTTSQNRPTFTRHFCLPSEATTDSKVLAKTFSDIRDLTGFPSQNDYCYMLAQMIDYLVSNYK